MDDFLAAEILYEAGLDPEYQLHKKGMLNLYRHLHRELDDTQKEWIKDMCYFRWMMFERELECAYALGQKHEKNSRKKKQAL